VKLLYFAWLRQKIGKGEEQRDLPPQTLRALIAHLKNCGPEYAEAFADENRIRAAINQDHAGLDAIAAPDDEVAFFPPVTGG
jgi:molybdopterin synthase sulfur carrier subunit